MPDDDQVTTFEWLKAVTARERIFIDRHMRLEDPLDPDEVEGVMSGVRESLEALRDGEERRRARVEEVKRVRYHAGRLAKGKGSEQDVKKVVEATVEAVEAGVPPSSLELRALLLPILDRLPRQDVPKHFGIVLREIDLVAEVADESPTRRPGSPRPTSNEVLRVRALLGGSTVVIIGGEERPETRRSLTRAFALAELDWHTLSDDPSLERLYRAIRRPGVSVVLYLIRWARHGFGEASDVADELGIPFVRIPAGYNPATVAHEILEQASERLGTRSR